MSSIHQVAINRALTLLSAAGCKFKIITAEGDEYGELEVVAPQSRKPVRRDLGHLYVDKMNKLPVGGHLIFDHPEPERLRSALSAKAATMWGNGAAITSREGNRIELLRVQ